MFYIKKKITDDIEIKIDIYENEIFTTCGDCGKEMQIESEHLADIIKDQALASTYVLCEECSKIRNNATPHK